MMQRLLGISFGIVVVVTACSGAHTPPPSTSATAATSSRTVFNDSALHARLCVPNRPDEDWRSVCTPRDQGVILIKQKP